MRVFKYPKEYPLQGRPKVTPEVHHRVNIPSRLLRQSMPIKKSIWAIGGGKGGIGKTLLTTNLAIFLSWLNRKVIAIDLDLGGANLHTSLGIDAPKKTLGHFLEGQTENPSELVYPTPFNNVSLISGAKDPLMIANIRHLHKARLFRKLKELDADVILMDLGAGTSSATVDFFLMADEKIVLTTPEPTSIENAYRFIKVAFFRLLLAHASTPPVKKFLESILEGDIPPGKTPAQLVNELQNNPDESLGFSQALKQLRMSLVINQVRTASEAELGRSMQHVCERYFGIQMYYLGCLSYDNLVWQSIRKRVPFLVESPNSQLVTQLEGILRNLVQHL